MPLELSLESLTDLAAGRADSAVDSNVAAENGGAKKRGREIAEGGCGSVVGGGEGFCGLKREMKLEAVD